MTSEEAQEERQRAEGLLSYERTGVRLQPAEPDPPVAELGALDGFGLLDSDHQVRISIYVFDRWGGGNAHAARLQAAAEAEGAPTLAAVNGALLFVGTAPAGDMEARFVLGDLCSAFAGQE